MSMQTSETKWHISTCDQVPDTTIHAAFKAGFIDYVIKISMTDEAFISRFFGPEGNNREYCHIAFVDGEPIAVLLGGIREFGGMRTMRCGGLCVAPDHRGSGIADKLMELHLKDALNQKCKQMFLEVIKGNDRAIRFYTRHGYSIGRDLQYFTLEHFNTGIPTIPGIDPVKSDYSYCEPSITHINLALFKDYHSRSDTYPNWQCDYPAIEDTPDTLLLGAKIDGRLIGALAMSPSGRIDFIHVMKDYRSKGIGSALFSEAYNLLQMPQTRAIVPSLPSYTGFLLKTGFTSDPIGQHEMYLPI